MLLLLCAGMAGVLFWVPQPRQAGRGWPLWPAVLAVQALHWGLTAYAVPRYLLWFELVATQMWSLSLVLALCAVARWRRVQLPTALYLAPLALLVVLSSVLTVLPLWRTVVMQTVLAAQAVLLAWCVARGGGDWHSAAGRGRRVLWAGVGLWTVLHVVQALVHWWPGPLWSVWHGAHVVALCATTWGYVLWQYEYMQGQHERWAVVDPHTAVTNPRGTLLALERMLSLARRAQQPLALLLVGLDDWERTRQTWGAWQADALLVAVAQRLQQRLRTHDVLGHAGPDTFWVVLPSTDIGGALVVADDMRTLFEREPLQHNGQVLRLRFSIGVHGRVPVDGGHTPEAMVQAAQRAWHMARQAGGNRIEIEV